MFIGFLLGVVVTFLGLMLVGRMTTTRTASNSRVPIKEHVAAVLSQE